MTIDKRFESAALALAGIGDGARVMISGFGGAGFPNALIRALVAHAPRELTLIVNSATHRLSITHELIAAGLVAHVVASAARGQSADLLSPMEERLRDGRIGLTLMPQGNFAEAIRAGGAGIPAFYSPVGADTDLGANRETRVWNGRNCVLVEALRGDLAIIRADVADRLGNMSFRHAQMNFGPAMATACQRTVAEVRLVEYDPLPPTRIQLSGVYVDAVVVTP